MRKDKLIFFLFILAGLALLNYPFVSQWVNRRSQSKVIYDYQDRTDRLQEKQKEELLAAARSYNEKLARQQTELPDGFSSGQTKDQDYESLLNLSENGVMGWIEIPSIDVMLPIYHGTGAAALEKGVGHLYGSSLPVGGTDTHAVLSAHTGLASKDLFTDLDKLKTGAHFYLYVLDETFAYEVVRTDVVLPQDTDLLHVVPGEDLVTLVTCTPYGINSHRLLVRGSRVPWSETDRAEEEHTSEGLWVWGRRIFVGSLVILGLAGILLLKPQRKGRKRNHGQKKE